jgi:hypothetical protein
LGAYPFSFLYGANGSGPVTATATNVGQQRKAFPQGKKVSSCAGIVDHARAKNAGFRDVTILQGQSGHGQVARRRSVEARGQGTLYPVRLVKITDGPE